MAHRPGTSEIWFGAIGSILGKVNRYGDGSDAVAVQTQRTPEYIAGMQFIDRDRLAIALDMSVEIIDVNTGAVLDSFPVQRPQRVIYHEGYLYVSSRGNKVVRRLVAGGPVEDVLTGPSVLGLSITPNTRGTNDLWISGSNVQSFSLTNPQTPTSIITEPPFARTLVHVSSRPFKQTIVISDSTGAVLYRCRKKVGDPISL